MPLPTEHTGPNGTSATRIPKHPQHPGDDQMPPYAPGGVPRPAAPSEPAERRAPPPHADTYPPKRRP